MHVSKRRATLAMTLLLAATACGGGGDGEGATPTTTEGPRSTTSSSTTTTTEPVDPSVVPDDLEDIDEEYVEAVANELYRVLRDANAIQVARGDLQGMVDRYNAVYAPEAADLLLNDALARSEADLAKFKQPPGSQRITVTSLKEVSEVCVVAESVRDSSEVLIEPLPPTEGFLVLTLREPGTRSPLNPTPWAIKAFSPTVEGEVACTSS